MNTLIPIKDIVEIFLIDANLSLNNLKHMLSKRNELFFKYNSAVIFSRIPLLDKSKIFWNIKKDRFSAIARGHYIDSCGVMAKIKYYQKCNLDIFVRKMNGKIDGLELEKIQFKDILLDIQSLNKSYSRFFKKTDN